MCKLSRILPLTLFCAATMAWTGPANADTEWEYEPGEGLHEEEWYDPSDWFNDDNDIDYEYDDWDYDYGYGDYEYEYDDDFGVYDYDYDVNDYDYGIYDNDAWDDDYDYNDRNAKENRQDRQDNRNNARNRNTREISGEVVSFERIRARDGQPESLRLKVRTDDGQTRTLQLGDRQYVSENGPRFRENEQIRIRGREVSVDGKPMFKAEQIRSRNGQFDLPSYEYNKTIQGRLVGVKKAVTRNGDLEAIVAKVRTKDGRTMNVLLGSPDDLRQARTVLRPNSEVNINGWTRNVGGERTFYVQDVDVRNSQNRQQQDRNDRNR